VAIGVSACTPAEVPLGPTVSPTTTTTTPSPEAPAPSYANGPPGREAQVDIAKEAQQLRKAFESEVPEHLKWTAGLPVADRLAHTDQALPADGPQAVLAVDRAANKQTIWVVVSSPGKWTVIGGTLVSTGKPGRKEHFKTPVGTFLNDGAILGYRAEGTFNENHVRGLGLKGMRVWDFGWQTTEDWRTPGATVEVRLEMHSTDPANLAHRIGRPDSEGCIRIPASLNQFLDKHGVIDRALTAAAPTDPATAQLISRQQNPTPLAGSAVIVYDSSEPQRHDAVGTGQAAR